MVSSGEQWLSGEQPLSSVFAAGLV